MSAGSLGRAQTGPEDKTFSPPEPAGGIFPPHLRSSHRLRMSSSAPWPPSPLSRWKLGNSLPRHLSATSVTHVCLQHRKSYFSLDRKRRFVVPLFESLRFTLLSTISLNRSLESRMFSKVSFRHLLPIRKTNSLNLLSSSIVFAGGQGSRNLI